MSDDWNKGHFDALMGRSDPFATGMRKVGQEAAEAGRTPGGGDFSGQGGGDPLFALCLLAGFASLPVIVFALYSLDRLFAMTGPAIAFWVAMSSILGILTLGPVFLLRQIGFGRGSGMGRALGLTFLTWIIGVPVYAMGFVLLVLPNLSGEPEQMVASLSLADLALPAIAPFLVATALLRKLFSKDRWIGGAIASATVLIVYGLAISLRFAPTSGM